MDWVNYAGFLKKFFIIGLLLGFFLIGFIKNVFADCPSVIFNDSYNAPSACYKTVSCPVSSNAHDLDINLLPKSGLYPGPDLSTFTFYNVDYPPRWQGGDSFGFWYVNFTYVVVIPWVCSPSPAPPPGPPLPSNTGPPVSGTGSSGFSGLTTILDREPIAVDATFITPEVVADLKPGDYLYTKDSSGNYHYSTVKSSLKFEYKNNGDSGIIINNYNNVPLPSNTAFLQSFYTHPADSNNKLSQSVDLYYYKLSTGTLDANLNNQAISFYIITDTLISSFYTPDEFLQSVKTPLSVSLTGVKYFSANLTTFYLSSCSILLIFLAFTWLSRNFLSYYDIDKKDDSD